MAVWSALLMNLEAHMGRLLVAVLLVAGVLFLAGCSRNQPVPSTPPPKGKGTQSSDPERPIPERDNDVSEEKKQRDKPPPETAEVDDRLLGLFPHITKEEYLEFLNAPEPPDVMVAGDPRSKAGAMLLLYGKGLALKRKEVGKEAWVADAESRIDDLLVTRPDKACMYARLAMFEMPTEKRIDLGLRVVKGWYLYLEKSKPNRAEHNDLSCVTSGVMKAAWRNALDLAMQKGFAALRSSLSADQKAGLSLVLSATEDLSNVEKGSELLVGEMCERGLFTPQGFKPLLVHKHRRDVFVRCIAKASRATQPQLIRWLSGTGALPEDVPGRRDLLADFLKSDDEAIQKAAEQAVAASGKEK